MSQEKLVELTPDQKEGLQVQNGPRERKGLKPLVWDEQLARNATQWAEHLAKVVGHMQHSTGEERPGQGENLFWGWASPGPYKNPYTNGAQSWMNEAPKYHGEEIGQANESCLHYSECTAILLTVANIHLLSAVAQCMWHSTTHIGMGMATDSKGAVYIVGRYSPQGNIVGQKPF